MLRQSRGVRESFKNKGGPLERIVVVLLRGQGRSLQIWVRGFPKPLSRLLEKRRRDLLSLKTLRRSSRLSPRNVLFQRSSKSEMVTTRKTLFGWTKGTRNQKRRQFTPLIVGRNRWSGSGSRLRDGTPMVGHSQLGPLVRNVCRGQQL